MSQKHLVLGHVGRGTGTFAPFDQVFDDCLLVTDPSQLKDVDALVIWGGEDISPSYYDEAPTENCMAGVAPSRRDLLEFTMMEAAIEMGKPIIGVCRGAQAVCALAGGKLVQDVNGHHGSHSIVTHDGRRYTTSSIHHQMMYPFKMESKDYQLLAWTDVPRSDGHYEGVRAAPPVEPEVIWFPKIKGLAIQGHPEFMHESSPFVAYCNELVQEHVLQ